MTNRTPQADAFIAEIIAVSRKHGMALSHEDGHGAFLVVPHIDEQCYRWLADAGMEHVPAEDMPDSIAHPFTPDFQPAKRIT